MLHDNIIQTGNYTIKFTKDKMRQEFVQPGEENGGMEYLRNKYGDTSEIIKNKERHEE